MLAQRNTAAHLGESTAGLIGFDAEAGLAQAMGMIRRLRPPVGKWIEITRRVRKSGDVTSLTPRIVKQAPVRSAISGSRPVAQ